MICGIVVTPPVLDRLVCKDTTSASRRPHGRETGRSPAQADDPHGRRCRLRRRRVQVAAGVGDLDGLAAQGGGTVRAGRPRLKGDRLGSLAQLAATSFTPVTVICYGQTSTVQAVAVRCLWYGVFAPTPSPSFSSASRPAAPAPTTADMIGKLWWVLIATKYQVTCPERPTAAEIHAIRLAWDTAAA
ncbi:hypothetical protein [Frankia sp. CiP3]|uniref:hypothetical protein n=1 Tax=Frankia sp. CiP3 TaxID=2880971 RepID=UPI001EF54574|nr:hypothetical protein [Frankia sp. CiP3]